MTGPHPAPTPARAVGPLPFQCYAGYAGWGAGQLEREIKEGTWLAYPADPKMVLEKPPAEVWSGTLRAMGIDPALLVSGGVGEA